MVLLTQLCKQMKHNEACASIMQSAASDNYRKTLLLFSSRRSSNLGTPMKLKRRAWKFPTCTLDFQCLSTFPIAKCVITVLPLLCLMSQRNVTRLCGLISLYNNIIEILKGVFVHCMIQTTYLFNEMANKFSISMDL